MKPKEGSLRTWHIPQVPMEAFYVEVATPLEGKKILDVLADYDTFQLEHRIKPDYSNVAGLQVYEHGEWCEWEDEDGNNIDNTDL